MATINESVSFDIDRLFNGAIDVDWISSAPEKAEMAAKSFVFHGPSSHGVSQGDIGDTAHRLIDTASFVNGLTGRIESRSGNAFTLAIAGYGSGKSHLAVTISELLSTPDDELKSEIISHIKDADSAIGANIESACRNMGRVLAITLNGMNNGDLSSSLLAHIKSRLVADGYDSSKLENLRERFRHAANLLKSLDEQLLQSLLADCSVSTREDVIAQLESFDETVYKKTHGFLAKLGINLSAVRDETAKDIINLTVREYVGKDKPYSHFVILFDEFGHYMEYATAHPQIAGEGALQHLFEGVQGNDDQVSFVGFIQYELKAYAQRLPSEYKNLMDRFITRFDNAAKLYLSSNLETLVASLLHKNKPVQIESDGLESMRRSIVSWYPVSQNFSTWAEPELFRRVIAQGCWPLLPVSMWVLFYLSSSGKYLQQRSALTLLKAALDLNAGRDASLGLSPVHLWTTELQQEFEKIEEETASGTLLQSYNTVQAKLSAHMTSAERDVLRAIVLLSQTQLRAESRPDAEYALEVFTGLEATELSSALRNLQEEYNVIEWDNSSCSYDILSDNASKPQFLHLLRQRAQEYDEDRRSEVFCAVAPRSSVFSVHDCSFAYDHAIQTPEWRYDSQFTFWSRFQKTARAISSALDNSSEFQTVDTPRGLVLFCFLPSFEDLALVKDAAHRILQREAKKKPIVLVLVQDDITQILSRSIVEIDILQHLSSEEKAKFGQLIPVYQEKRQRDFDKAVKDAVLARHYITPFDNVQPDRLPKVESSVFESAFPKVVTFPVDGYSSGRSGAARTCVDLVKRLVGGELTYADTQSMNVETRNRAQKVLKTGWGVFSKSDGTVMQHPSNTVVRSVFTAWEAQLTLDSGLNCKDAIRIACAAPYGANVASAMLLFAAFIQAFQKSIQIQCDNSPISPKVLAEKIFSGTSLDIGYLATVNIYRMTGENGPWDELYNNWSSCNSYREQAEFVEKIVELEETLPPPPVLRLQISLCLKAAKDAKSKIDESDERESRAIQKIEQGRDSNRISLIAYGASLLQSQAKTLRNDPMWDVHNDIEPMVRKVQEAKTDIAAGFDDWMNQQRPRGNTQQDLIAFKKECDDHMGRNLKNLGMTAENERLSRHVERIARAFEHVIFANDAISGFDNWEVSLAALSDSTPVRRLLDVAAECEKREESLKDAAARMRRTNNAGLLDEITRRLERLTELQKQLKERRKAIDKRAGAIINQDLSISTAAKLLDEVEELTVLYAGEEQNLEDFRAMRNMIKSFLDIVVRLDSMSIPQSQFDVLVTETREDFLGKFSETEDFDPPWLPDEVFDAMAAGLERNRRRASADWMTKMKERYSQIDDLSMQEAESALREVSQVPPYFYESRDGATRDILIRKLEKHLESKGVEWLVEKFKQLTPSGQREFIKLIKQ